MADHVPNVEDDDLTFRLVDRDVDRRPPNRPFSSLNTAVAELDETQVRRWSPRQVAGWMRDAGFEATVVEKFLAHDISGVVLLDLQFEDLKELDITSFGKRHRVMSSIKQLRNSSMLAPERGVSLSPPKNTRVHADAVLERAASVRRGRFDGRDDLSPGDSASIVAIEQVMPKPHSCSKGEQCVKFQKRQKKIQRLRAEFGLDSSSSEESDTLRPTSDALPSVVASSDLLGPGAMPDFDITPQKLQEISKRDPQENVRQFLSFQHVQPPTSVKAPSPPPASSASFTAPPPQPQPEAHPMALADHLRHLPKLTIPIESPAQLGPYTPADAPSGAAPPRSAISAFRNPVQCQLKVQLQSDPYHYGGVASPADLYTTETPFSATDIPVTSFPVEPLTRDVSQSVPPEMRYGAPAQPMSDAEQIARPGSTQPAASPARPHHRRQNSFTPSIAPLPEMGVVGARPKTHVPRPPGHRPEPPVAPLKLDDVHHSGWMRKRKTKLLRHEWQDAHFTLRGTRLAMHRDNRGIGAALEVLDVDDYAVACSSLASSSKLSAAFKRSILGGSSKNDKGLSDQAFTFSLVPPNDRNVFPSTSKSHHFAVKTRDERIDWMRELMLAKALKRGAERGEEIRMNGHMI